MAEKILILDGISGISLGREINAALCDLNISSIHIAAEKLPRKPFYKPVSAIKKALHKQLLKKDYYRNPKITSRSITQLLEEQKPDTVFVIGFLYRFFDLELIQALKKKLGFKLFLYDTDSCNLFSNKRELLYFFNHELPVYDHIFSFSKTTTQFINKLKSLDASYFPFGANPIAAPEISCNTIKENDVLFIGSADMRRIFLLEYLIDYKLCVYGSKWQRNKDLMSEPLKQTINYQALWGSELHSLLHQSKIILNITRSSFYGVETGLNLRIFETLAAGGFLLTDYCEELNELFNIGQHIEIYKDAAEMQDKVDYYLRHEEQRKKIAAQGYEHFMKNYTWKSRIEELLSKI